VSRPDRATGRRGAARLTRMNETVETAQAEIETTDAVVDDYPTGMLANPTRVRN
jgi:hypothetical protein